MGVNCLNVPAPVIVIKQRIKIYSDEKCSKVVCEIVGLDSTNMTLIFHVKAVRFEINNVWRSGGCNFVRRDGWWRRGKVKGHVSLLSTLRTRSKTLLKTSIKGGWNRNNFVIEHFHFLSYQTWIEKNTLSFCQEQKKHPENTNFNSKLQ